MPAFMVADLPDLLGPRKGPCVSIYMPTSRLPDRAAEDRLRFKNLVDEARRKLTAVVAPRAVPRLLAPLADYSEPGFWRDQLDGLAVFTSPGFARAWRVPTPVEERVFVADTFHVRPLIRSLQSDRRWYLLMLAGERAALFQGSSTGLIEKRVPDMPRTPKEADVDTAHEKPPRSGHTAGVGRFIYEGGSAPRAEREDKARWYRAIDRSVSRALRDEHAPLVLAGVSRAQGIYRAISRYPHLVPEGLDGNFGRASVDELFERAAPVAATALGTRVEEAVTEYHRINGAARSSDDLTTIAEASVAGRVRRLLVAQGRTVRGRFDRESGAIEKRAAREDAYGDDVLDDLAEAVLVRGGDVLVVDKERMPSKSPVAAVLRW
jgi:hypothetical protein